MTANPFQRTHPIVVTGDGRTISIHVPNRKRLLRKLHTKPAATRRSQEKIYFLMLLYRRQELYLVDHLLCHQQRRGVHCSFSVKQRAAVVDIITDRFSFVGEPAGPNSISIASA